MTRRSVSAIRRGLRPLAIRSILLTTAIGPLTTWSAGQGPRSGRERENPGGQIGESEGEMERERQSERWWRESEGVEGRERGEEKGREREREGREERERQRWMVHTMSQSAVVIHSV